MVIVYNDCVVWSWVHSSCLPYFRWKFGKLEKKNLDMIVANDVSKPQAGFNVNTNIIKLLKHDGSIEELPLMSKKELAYIILERVMKLRM